MKMIVISKWKYCVDSSMKEETGHKKHQWEAICVCFQEHCLILAPF